MTLSRLRVPAADTCTDDCCSVEPSLVTAPVNPPIRAWAWRLTALTIGWNSAEAIVAIASGLLASSVALVGFGLESVIEVSSALVIVWRLLHRSIDHATDQQTERRAVRLIALSFLALGSYIVYDAVTTLFGLGEEPERSIPGLVLLALSLVVMPALAWGKRRVASAMQSVALKADSAQTQLCTYVSAVTLIGIGANAFFGWWWMDPIAGLVVAAIAMKEGWEAWRSGDLCC